MSYVRTASLETVPDLDVGRRVLVTVRRCAAPGAVEASNGGDQSVDCRAADSPRPDAAVEVPARSRAHHEIDEIEGCTPRDSDV